MFSFLENSIISHEKRELLKPLVESRNENEPIGSVLKRLIDKISEHQTSKHKLEFLFPSVGQKNFLSQALLILGREIANILYKNADDTQSPLVSKLSTVIKTVQRNEAQKAPSVSKIGEAIIAARDTIEMCKAPSSEWEVVAVFKHELEPEEMIKQVQLYFLEKFPIVEKRLQRRQVKQNQRKLLSLLSQQQQEGALTNFQMESIQETGILLNKLIETLDKEIEWFEKQLRELDLIRAVREHTPVSTPETSDQTEVVGSGDEDDKYESAREEGGSDDEYESAPEE